MYAEYLNLMKIEEKDLENQMNFSKKLGNEQRFGPQFLHLKYLIRLFLSVRGCLPFKYTDDAEILVPFGNSNLKGVNFGSF